MLKPITGLEFFPEPHRYRYNGKWVSRSVTEILSFDMSDEAKANIEATRHEWEERGNTVHLFLHHMLCGAALPAPGAFSEWTTPLENCWLFDDAEVIASELMLVNEKKQLAGSCDFILRTKKGTTCLADLKTVASIKAMQRRKPANAQLGAYLEAINLLYPDLYIDKCVTLVSAPGQCRVLSSEPDECSMAWVDAWDKYKAHLDVMPF